MAKEPEAVEELPQPVKTSGGGNPLIPIIAIVVLVPILTVSVFEFYIFPKFNKMVAHAEEAAIQEEDAEKESEEGVIRGENIHTYEVPDIVANLSGSMQSRYVKTSFTLESRVVGFEEMMTQNNAKIIDAALGVLSSLTLQDLEQAGIKNIVRNDLLNAISQSLNGNFVDQLYFSEFVVQ